MTTRRCHFMKAFCAFAAFLAAAVRPTSAVMRGIGAARRIVTSGPLAVCLALAASGSAAFAAPAAAPITPTPAIAASKTPNVAFYYQADLPVDELQAFDVVVVDPNRVRLPHRELAPHTAWFARLDLRNTVQRPAAGLEDYFNRVVEPLWKRGYRGFLLDDGAGLGDGDARQDAAITTIIDQLRARHPDARMMLRNHLRLAQAAAPGLYALVVDALYRQRAPYGDFLAQVAPNTRAAALRSIADIKRHASLPVVAIDYCATGNQACRRETAQRLAGDGLIPFVTTPDMATVGVGNIEVMPRKILMVQATRPDESLDQSVGAYTIAMPLNYLGYDIRYVDVNRGLPNHVTNDRYAGIVVSIGQLVYDANKWRQWLLARIGEGMRVAVIGQYGFPIDAQAAHALNLELVHGTIPAGGTPQVVSKAAMMGFEVMPQPDVRTAVGIRVSPAGHALLRLRSGTYVYDAAGMLPWGGYVLDPFGVVSMDGIDQNRWGIQPITFLRQALALPDMPVPDVTTENGRRLFFTHVDGDGFASRGEFSGARDKYSGQILYDRVLSKYKVPMTISVIEGEVGPTGVYPQLSPVLEPIARKIFAMPNVEIGTHTYSHPFFMWQIDNATGRITPGALAADKASGENFGMPIPHYDFNIDREIRGSVAYINDRLAPPGKSVVAVLWPGDAAAPRIALDRAAGAGLLNINGGDTIITKTNDSWADIAPYGVAKGDRPGEYQVYAAIMNENVYTNDWLGPYYGFSRVIETLEMTDKPIRFKAIDIYYHFYSATKAASVKALTTVFDWALQQPILPIYTTEYIQRVLDWRRVSIARQGNRWLVRSGSSLRELRWPGAGVPDLSSSTGISGYLPGPGGVYVHMGADQASFTLSASGNAHVPYIAQASGFVRGFERSNGSLQFEFGGYYKPFVELNAAGNCKATVDGGSQATRARSGVLRLAVSGNASKPVSYHLIKVNCE